MRREISRHLGSHNLLIYGRQTFFFQFKFNEPKNVLHQKQNEYLVALVFFPVKTIFAGVMKASPRLAIEEGLSHSRYIIYCYLTW